MTTSAMTLQQKRDLYRDGYIILKDEEGNNPWERSKDAMCDMWDEWEGMREVVAEEQARERAAA